MPYSRFKPGAYACKGWCDRFGGVKRLSTLGGGTKKLSSVGGPKYRYFNGARYCRRCEKFFLKEIVYTFDREIYCPCCGSRTTGRSRDRKPTESIPIMEIKN
jgi:hypothetical protein